MLQNVITALCPDVEFNVRGNLQRYIIVAYLQL